MNNTEEWKYIKGFESKYQASNKGNIKSVDREVVCKNGIIKYFKGRLLKPFLSKNGVMSITISFNNKSFNKSLPNLVYSTFNEAMLNVGTKIHIKHIDGNIYNNQLENLEVLSGNINLRNSGRNIYPKRR